MNEPVTICRPIGEISFVPAPNKKLELRADVRKEKTPRSNGGMFSVLPFDFASAISVVAFKVFLTAQPQKNNETGNVVLARVGREENTVERSEQRHKYALRIRNVHRRLRLTHGDDLCTTRVWGTKMWHDFTRGKKSQRGIRTNNIEFRAASNLSGPLGNGRGTYHQTPNSRRTAHCHLCTRTNTIKMYWSYTKKIQGKISEATFACDIGVSGLMLSPNPAYETATGYQHSWERETHSYRYPTTCTIPTTIDRKLDRRISRCMCLVVRQHINAAFSRLEGLHHSIRLIPWLVAISANGASRTCLTVEYY
jgi:hypothetical protein